MLTTQEEHENEVKNWRNKIMLTGAVVGAVVGVGAAFLYLQRAQDPDHQPEFGAGEGLRVGLLLLGLLRQISELGDNS